MEKGDVLGHEFMGIIEDVGPDVTKFKIGDRVVVSAIICCGKCMYCKKGLTSCCDWTNPSKDMEKQYGHRSSGVFGYSHLTGGYEGGQAEYVRVPLADNNLLKVPKKLSDEKVLLLSDVICTGWHANVLGGVTEGTFVAIWGCGPVGLMTAMWAKFKNATKIIMIDCDENRLRFAREKLDVITINFEDGNVCDAIKKHFPMGPDVAIDCVGFRFAKSTKHKLQRSLKLEKDVPEVLTECITSVRKGGVVSIIGDYFSKANKFPIGAFMEKSLTMRGGQVCVQTYWKELLGYIKEGQVDPTFVITHTMPLDRAQDAYDIFDNHDDKCLKILLKPFISQQIDANK